jgi:hypothetical protein
LALILIVGLAALAPLLFLRFALLNANVSLRPS